MADEVKQEIQEGQEKEQVVEKKLLSKPIVIVLVTALFVLGAGAFIFMKPGRSEARESGAADRQDMDSWKEIAGEWRIWDLGTVWVMRHTDKVLSDRKISAKFKLLVARSFLEGLEAPLQEVLKSEVEDLIQSILYSRESDIRNDPKRARLLVRDDILRGLKMGANPNNPEQKTYQFPFNEENLKDVFVKELQVTRW